MGKTRLSVHQNTKQVTKKWTYDLTALRLQKKPKRDICKLSHGKGERWFMYSGALSI